MWKFYSCKNCKSTRTWTSNIVKSSCKSVEKYLMICIDIRCKDGRSGCEGLWTNKGTELGSSSTGLLSWRRMVMAVHRLVQQNVVVPWSLVDIICNFGTNNSTKKVYILFEFCRRVWPSYTATCKRSRHGSYLSRVRFFF